VTGRLFSIDSVGGSLVRCVVTRQMAVKDAVEEAWAAVDIQREKPWGSSWKAFAKVVAKDW